MKKIKEWTSNKELRYILLPVSAIIPIAFILLLIAIRLLRDEYFSNINLNWIPGTFITALLISPSAYLIWLWRNQDKMRDQNILDNQVRTDKEIKEYDELYNAMRCITSVEERLYVRISATLLFKKYLLSSNQLLQKIAFDFLKNIINGIVSDLKKGKEKEISKAQSLICKSCIDVIDLAIKQDNLRKYEYIHNERESILSLPNAEDIDNTVAVEEMFVKNK